MLAKVIGMATFVALAGFGAAFAQTDGPAEVPDDAYQGQSYIDTNGCVFLKAGYGGTTSWVPRVGQDRKPICGQTPTNAIAKVADAVARPPVAAPKAKPRKPHLIASHKPEPVMIGCPISVPIARRYATTDGGSVVICTATNGSLTGARSPIYPGGSRVGAALSSQQTAGVVIPLPTDRPTSAQPGGAINPPPGYEVAWKDGRLNPMRGVAKTAGQVRLGNGTSDGDVQPSAPVKAESGHYFVQVGAFGEPANADGASARLKALGLPVSKSQFSRQGKVLQVVYAGPFASGADAKMALLSARGLGFTDAFLR